MPTQRSFGFHPRIAADPDRLNRGTLVYAITDGQAVKLGKSDGDPRVRLASLQTGNARVLQLVAYTSGLTERQVHRRYHRSRGRGEWFAVSLSLVAELKTWDYLDERVLADLRASL